MQLHEDFIQMDMLDNSPLDWIKQEIKLVRTRTDNCRKGLFARHNELAKMYQKISEENEELKLSLHQLKRDVQHLKECSYLMQTA